MTQVTIHHVQCFVYGTGNSRKLQQPSCTVLEKLFAHPVYVFTSTLVVVDTTMFVLIPILLRMFLFVIKIRFDAVFSFQQVKIEHDLDHFDFRILVACYEIPLAKSNVFPIHDIGVGQWRNTSIKAEH